jgi:transmembrane sensor
MSSQAFEIEELITRYLNKELTDEEQRALDEWLANDKNRKFFDELTNEDNLNNELNEYKYFHARKNQGRKKLHELLLAGTPFVPVKKLWVKYVAAASVLTVVATGGIYLLVNQNKKQATVQTTPAKAVVQDVPPGGDKAILTLGDGSTLVLDDAQNGVISTQGSASVVKEDGEVKYEVKGKELAVTYNTLATPRGGQYRLVLPDGSKAWLNAASSVRYPVAFAGNERKVEMSGEVYFEVEKNPKKPFIVSIVQGATKDQRAEVEVLGTHFNINSYKDEPLVKTTLLEGKVKVSSAIGSRESSTLRPGQQSELNNTGSIAVKKDVDVDQVMAWKNGQFRFRNADLRTIMRQVSRWYDVDVKFETSANPGYNLLLNRNMNVSKIIEVLDESGGAHFKIEGKTIRVLP